jgi:hypothetical protein
MLIVAPHRSLGKALPIRPAPNLPEQCPGDLAAFDHRDAVDQVVLHAVRELVHRWQHSAEGQLQHLLPLGKAGHLMLPITRRRRNLDPRSTRSAWRSRSGIEAEERRSGCSTPGTDLGGPSARTYITRGRLSTLLRHSRSNRLSPPVPGLPLRMKLSSAGGGLDCLFEARWLALLAFRAQAAPQYLFPRSQRPQMTTCAAQRSQ